MQTLKLAMLLVGLASFGQASYETEYNGGMGSNGLTSARHDVFDKYLANKYPESFDAAVPEDLVYSGAVKLTDSVENSPLDAGKVSVVSNTDLCTYYQRNLLSKYTCRIHSRYGALLWWCTKQKYYTL